jgi:TatD DNase family protein
MYIDTHCHLQFEHFQKDLSEVIHAAQDNGVTQCIVPGVDTLSCNLATALAHEFPAILFASVGFHPYEAAHRPDVTKLETLLREKNTNSAIVAIGECGLDYHLYKGEAALGKKQEQKMLFEEQIRLANRLNLPVIMHCRDAFDDFFDVLDSVPSMPRGVIHCFSGGLQEIRFAQQRHLYIGVDGNLTYSKLLQQIVPKIPLDMILLETDAPYLTPAPYRGTRNEPRHIPLIAQAVADLHHVSQETVATTTTTNALSLFGLSHERNKNSI